MNWQPVFAGRCYRIQACPAETGRYRRWREQTELRRSGWRSDAGLDTGQRRAPSSEVSSGDEAAAAVGLLREERRGGRCQKRDAAERRWIEETGRDEGRGRARLTLFTPGQEVERSNIAHLCLCADG